MSNTQDKPVEATTEGSEQVSSGPLVVCDNRTESDSIHLPSGASTQDFTGERFLPGLSMEIELEHLHRYMLATHYVKQKAVLDIASGEGYGSYMLAQVAQSVIGVDIDEASVVAAREKYARPQLQFLKGSCEKLPVEDDSIDVVVSFETIEHITQQELFLREVKRVLRQDGLLIISSPERDTYHSYRQGENEFHVKELSREELVTLLTCNFAHVAVGAQRNVFGSVISGEGFSGASAIFSREAEKIEKVSELPRSPYLIAFASDGEIPELVPSVFDGGSSPYLVSSLTGGIGERDREIINLRHHVELLNDAKSKGEELVPLLEQEVSAVEVKAEYLFRELHRTQVDLVRKSQKLLAYRQRVADLDAKAEYIYREWGNAQAMLQAEVQNRPRLYSTQVRLERLAYKVVRKAKRVPAKLWRIAQKMLGCYAPPQATIPPGFFFDEKFFLEWNQDARIAAEKSVEHYLKDWYPVPRPHFNDGELDALQVEIAQLASASKSLVVEKSQSPTVSVVIPIYNHLRITLLCIRSLLRIGARIPFEVILVDDCSEESTAKVLAELPGIRYVRQPVNGGFIASCNRGANEAAGEYLLFLNNDTQLLPDWMDHLYETFKARAAVGLVGSQLIYPNGQLQEAAGIIWRDGAVWNYGRGCNRLLPEFNYLRPVDYCSGASIMVPRTLFFEVGCFDTYYSPAYAEDADLGLKIRQAGYQVLYQPASRVVHCEGISSGTDSNKGVKAYQKVNLLKLYDRWCHILLSHGQSGAAVELERERGVKKRALFLDALTPTPDRDAGSQVIWAFMKIFLKLGYGVTFVPEDNLLPIEGYTERLQRMGVECWHYPFISSIDAFLEQHGKKFDVIFLYRAPHAARRLDAVRRYAPQARVVLNTVDLHFVRQEREARLDQSEEKLQLAEKMKQQELAVMQKTDATILLNSREVELVRELAPQVKTFMLPLIQEVPGSRRAFSERAHIVFLGGFAHPPNADAVLFFCTEVLPLVKARLAGVKFIVVGSNPPQSVLERASADVDVRGFVENLDEIFDNCRLSVAPLRYGAGMKGKIVTSLSYGVPCITTSIGSEGMGLSDGVNITIQDEAGAIADAVVELYSSEERWNELSSGGVEFAKQTFAPEVVEKNIAKMMGELVF